MGYEPRQQSDSQPLQSLSEGAALKKNPSPGTEEEPVEKTVGCLRALPPATGLAEHNFQAYTLVLHVFYNISLSC